MRITSSPASAFAEWNSGFLSVDTIPNRMKRQIWAKRALRCRLLNGMP